MQSELETDDYDMETEDEVGGSSQVSVGVASEQGQSLPSTADSGYDTLSGLQTESEEVEMAASSLPSSLTSTPLLSSPFAPSPISLPAAGEWKQGHHTGDYFHGGAHFWGDISEGPIFQGGMFLWGTNFHYRSST